MILTGYGTQCQLLEYYFPYVSGLSVLFEHVGLGQAEWNRFGVAIENGSRMFYDRQFPIIPPLRALFVLRVGVCFIEPCRYQG